MDPYGTAVDGTKSSPSINSGDTDERDSSMRALQGNIKKTRKSHSTVMVMRSIDSLKDLSASGYKDLQNRALQSFIQAKIPGALNNSTNQMETFSCCDFGICHCYQHIGTKTFETYLPYAHVTLERSPKGPHSNAVVLRCALTANHFNSETHKTVSRIDIRKAMFDALFNCFMRRLRNNFKQCNYCSTELAALQTITEARASRRL